ncbi:recombinase family protein [Massilia sp. CCM 9210]|uniref:recombinase family protein n=1 Tax=Massilia scottii TaxID=3057166 RepID=UPI0027968B29|nr:recombinase family protein [Massilia sp. CCM 9210]MDQ1817459.1 recombinase family protein [Massilia sp. CCM 9210]
MSTKNIDICIARLHALYLEGLPYHEIADALTNEGFTTLRGCKFTQQVVNSIINRFVNGCTGRYTVAFKRAGAGAQA